MSFYAEEPQTVGKVLDNTFRLYKASFKKVIVFAVIYALVAVIPILVLELSPLASSADLTAYFIVIGVITILMMVPVMMVFNAMFYRVHNVAIEEECTAGEALIRSVKKVLPVIVAMIIYLIAVVLGMVLLIVPGIFLAMSLFFYVALIVIDDEKILTSLKKSHSLVWGNWWRTSLVFLVPFLIMMSVSTVLGIVAVLMGGMAAGSFTDPATYSSTTFIIVSNLINIPIYAVTMPLFVAVMLVQLNDLKLRKQGTDLEARMAV